jgi:nitrogen fixation protein NifU and related proteins
MLNDLYQEIILDHSKRPRNRRPMAGASSTAEGYNPLCGDKIKLYVDYENGLVKGISFEGSGCAISTASASLMTEALKGKTRADAEALIDRFHNLLTKETKPGAELGKLAVFSGVREFPVRVKCATLAWHTLKAALNGVRETVSTEEEL